MTLFDLAQRFVGEIVERPGDLDNPFIVWCHESTTMGAAHDEVPWCSSFVNRLAWMLRLPRSKKANARSWLEIGAPVELAFAKAGYDVVVLKRGTNPAQGHVGVFVGWPGQSTMIQVIGGNQSNGVSMQTFQIDDILGIRRLQA